MVPAGVTGAAQPMDLHSKSKDGLEMNCGAGKQVQMKVHCVLEHEL